jgi:lysophospholipid acyltransferase 7
LVGLAFEVHDTFQLKKHLYGVQTDKLQDEKTDFAELELKIKFQQVQPTFIDIFHYAFCYIGVLTGDISSFSKSIN